MVTQHNHINTLASGIIPSKQVVVGRVLCANMASLIDCNAVGSYTSVVVHCTWAAGYCTFGELPLLRRSTGELLLSYSVSRAVSEMVLCFKYKV